MPGHDLTKTVLCMLLHILPFPARVPHRGHTKSTGRARLSFQGTNEP